MRKRSGIVGIALVAVVAAFAPGAQGATTLGSDLSLAPGDGIFCASACSFAQMEIPGRTVVAPANGVLVRWRIRTDGPGGPFALRVMRPVSGTTVTGIATSANELPMATGISEFETRLAIRQGDHIGLNFTSTNTASFKHGMGTPGALALYFSPTLDDGASLPATAENNSTELLFNADFEQDADGDTFGDNTQDICPTIAGGVAGCAAVNPLIVAAASKRQKVKSLSAKVTLDRVAAVSVQAVVQYKSGKKRIKSKLAEAMVGPGVKTKFKLKFTSAQRSKLDAQLKLGKKLTAKITYIARDALTNRATATSSVRLKR
ncbi:MAG: hypothetical protein ACRDKE_00245 [Solirubrobacterales bacterium]